MKKPTDAELIDARNVFRLAARRMDQMALRTWLRTTRRDLAIGACCAVATVALALGCPVVAFTWGIAAVTIRLSI